MRLINRIFGASVGHLLGSHGAPRAEARRTPARSRLVLESLDPRLAPSSLVETGLPDPTLVSTETQTTRFLGDSKTGQADDAPVIVDFKAVMVTANLFEFTGDVVDAAPGGLTVKFGGEPNSLQGKSISTNASGHFNLSIVLNLDGSDCGTATAQTTNAAGRTSELALAIVIAR